MSRYDYPDPGVDPAYCDDLSAVDDDGMVIEEGSVCLFCGQPINPVPYAGSGTNDYDFYCSSLCAHYAELDSREDR